MTSTLRKCATQKTFQGITQSQALGGFGRLKVFAKDLEWEGKNQMLWGRCSNMLLGNATSKKCLGFTDTELSFGPGAKSTGSTGLL